MRRPNRRCGGPNHYRLGCHLHLQRGKARRRKLGAATPRVVLLDDPPRATIRLIAGEINELEHRASSRSRQRRRGKRTLTPDGRAFRGVVGNLFGALNKTRSASRSETTRPRLRRHRGFAKRTGERSGAERHFVIGTDSRRDCELRSALTASSLLPGEFVGALTNRSQANQLIAQSPSPTRASRTARLPAFPHRDLVGPCFPPIPSPFGSSQRLSHRGSWT